MTLGGDYPTNAIILVVGNKGLFASGINCNTMRVESSLDILSVKISCFQTNEAGRRVAESTSQTTK